MRLILCSAVVRMFAMAAAMAATAHPASAQSFFQQLFGFGSSKPAATAQSTASQKAYSERLTTGLRANRSTAYREQSVRPGDEDFRRDPGYGGSYRTVCVRMCDGYYWPVSGSVSSERFDADARRCDANCVGEAKLFYLPKSSDNIRGMVSLDGKVYGKMKTAFLYRKTLINGCGCKPAPWSVAETYRHDQYEAVVASKRAQDDALRNRAMAEAALPDQISMLIAATAQGGGPKIETLAPVLLASIETVPAAAIDVVSAFEDPQDIAPDVLHFMPGLDSDSPISVSVADEPRTPASEPELMDAVAKVAVWALPERSSDAGWPARSIPRAADVRDARRNRASRQAANTRLVRGKPTAVQSSWLTPSPGQYRWPGD